MKEKHFCANLSIFGVLLGHFIKFTFNIQRHINIVLNQFKQFKI